MQIPHQLPQFENRTVLLVVMGSQRGLLYLASDSRIDIIGTVEQPPARYTDREGFFMNTGAGRVFGSGGAGYEDNNIERIRRFYKQVAHEVYRVVRAHGIDHTYVFEPPYAKGAVTQALRPVLPDQVELVRYGNYLHAPATVLLRYIQTANEAHIDPADPQSVSVTENNAEEKRKLLSHAQLARRVIGRV